MGNLVVKSAVLRCIFDIYDICAIMRKNAGFCNLSVVAHRAVKGELKNENMVGATAYQE
jgi:hypothetical protein